jgi:uncharacterized protein (TIGR03000 family)
VNEAAPAAADSRPRPAEGERRPERRPLDGNPATERLGPPEEEAPAPAPATVVIRLPAEARLTINNAATHQTSSTRTFVSPPLQPGKEVHYTLKAELVRDGKAITATKRVALRAGEERQVSLAFPSAAGATPE